MPRHFDLDIPNRILSRCLEGIDFIDLTEDYRGYDPREIFYLEGHFTERGHRLATRVLTDKLKLE